MSSSLGTKGSKDPNKAQEYSPNNWLSSISRREGEAATDPAPIVVEDERNGGAQLPSSVTDNPFGDNDSVYCSTATDSSQATSSSDGGSLNIVMQVLAVRQERQAVTTAAVNAAENNVATRIQNGVEEGAVPAVRERRPSFPCYRSCAPVIGEDGVYESGGCHDLAEIVRYAMGPREGYCYLPGHGNVKSPTPVSESVQMHYRKDLVGRARSSSDIALSSQPPSPIPYRSEMLTYAERVALTRCWSTYSDPSKNDKRELGPDGGFKLAPHWPKEGSFPLGYGNDHSGRFFSNPSSPLTHTETVEGRGFEGVSVANPTP